MARRRSSSNELSEDDARRRSGSEFEDDERNRMLETMESPSQGLSQLCESSKQTPKDEFLQTTTRNTITGLKDCRELNVNPFIVLATIKHVVDDNDWWYTVCICNKAVYPDSKMFFCEKCNKHVMKVTLRYKVQLRVIDDTDFTTFMLFDREASSLLSKSCTEMFESHDKNGNLPNEFAQILEKNILFKVDSKMDKGFRFEQTRVKKICVDEDIIQCFISDNNSSLFGSECNESQSQTVDLSNENVIVTPLKRQSPPLLQVGKDNLPLKTFKRTVKIEK
ncbi:hypothetical protein PHAVU_006G191400 [Phaseolus vulgaris]|uniref:Replication factor A C-terminal domain-containing protein n=1 Tax=Phaseolus vulgaris TaxID=3885 RepID=V7BUI5_PHAVU|nr:hypothetical protein PHAVU_006G191400g [Phaseolus vulgaris]ESW20231.1 hypothetical protein PHAVU_006G191400g [Phaseolus vulgaris]